MILMDFANYIRTVSRRDLYRYLAVFFAVLTLVMGGSLFFYFRRMNYLSERLARVAKSRGRARKILKNRLFVRKQQENFEEILEKERDFLITQFIDKIVTELNLVSKRGQTRSLPDTNLNNGYSEEQLEVNFSDMDMKEVVELLYKIEQKDRVYVKKLDLLRSKKADKIKVNLIIATLQPNV